MGKDREGAVLYIVVPCYNEEVVLPITSKLFLEKLKELIEKGKINADSRVLFVNDGSKDNTWDIIKALVKTDEHFVGIAQSRNRGHQNAVLAGLMEAKDKCDITISIDCDGQDDINAMDEMIDKYIEGNEIVYGVRGDRKTDSFFKRFTAESYYKVLKSMGADVVFNHADYRLVSSRVLQEFSNFKEVNLYLRGLIPLVGFSSTSVYYSRNKRMAGESHYPLSKMLHLAFDGITSLSVKPIKMVLSLGIVITCLSIVCLVILLVYFLSTKVSNDTYLILSVISLIGGIQLTSIGVIGEYIGKMYMEVKGRPRYIISERVGNFKDKN